jgi:proteasome lid subunit RPN8/RPN11
MGRIRIEVDSNLSPKMVSGRVLNELCSHARETQPEECCGLVTGNDEEPYRSVYRCRNDMTLCHRKDPVQYPRDGEKAFYMNEVDYLTALKEAEKVGESVRAIYHSHVGAGTYFSEMDQEFAEHELFPFPDVAHIVIAVWEGPVTKLGIFESEVGKAGFVGRRLEARSDRS